MCIRDSPPSFPPSRSGRAQNTQLYVWNLDTQQLTAIVQHENGCTFTRFHSNPEIFHLTPEIPVYLSVSLPSFNMRKDAPSPGFAFTPIFFASIRKLHLNPEIFT
eukprot:2553462-Rhodomonas_salina.2